MKNCANAGRGLFNKPATGLMAAARLLAVSQALQNVGCRDAINLHDLLPRGLAADQSTLPRGQSSVSVSRRSKASFAAASTGGAVTLMRSSAPCASPISFFEARGCNLMARVTPFGLDCDESGQ